MPNPNRKENQPRDIETDEPQRRADPSHPADPEEPVAPGETERPAEDAGGLDGFK